MAHHLGHKMMPKVKYVLHLFPIPHYSNHKMMETLPWLRPIQITTTWKKGEKGKRKQTHYYGSEMSIKKRMDGEPYLGFQKDAEGSKVVQNKPKQGRTIKETCKSPVCEKAKNRHCNKFSQAQRTEIFRRFWSMSWIERKAFMCAHVTQVNTRKNTVPGGISRRDFTLEYRLSNGSLDGNLQVCREMFLNTLGIGYRMMQLWVKKSNYNIPTASDRSGQRNNERTSERMTIVKNFFGSLPKMPSHYARKNSSKLYLEPVFSTKKEVYKIYKEFCENHTHSEPYSFKTFCAVFDDQNLSLFCVKKDKCNTCSSHETGNITDTDYNEHVAKKIEHVRKKIKIKRKLREIKL